MVSSSIWPPFASSEFFGGEASREATRGHGTLVCVGISQKPTFGSHR
jgi:hypothetical protein